MLRSNCSRVGNVPVPLVPLSASPKMRGMIQKMFLAAIRAVARRRAFGGHEQRNRGGATSTWLFTSVKSACSA